MSDLKTASIDRLKARIVEVYSQARLDERQKQLIGIHDLDHVSRVLNNIREIIDGLNSPTRSQLHLNVLQAAALLHDIGYALITDGETERREHIEASITYAKQILPTVGATAEQVEEVCSLIASHHRYEHTGKRSEEKILYVADKLDMIGLDGTARMFLRYGLTSWNCATVAQKLLKKMEARVQNDLLKVGVGEGLVQARWLEAELVLKSIIARSKMLK